MSMADQLWNYFRNCPLIDKKQRLNFNALGAKPAEFSIEDEPENPILCRYIDGSSVRSKTFTLASRQPYGLNARLNIEKSGYFEKLRHWIEQQNRKRLYPTLEGGQRATRLEALTDGYLFTSDGDTARYHIKLRLTYFEKGER